MQFFPSLEHSEATAGLFIDLISCCCVSGNREAQGERMRDREREGEMGEWPVGGAVRTHTIFIHSVHCLTGAQFMKPPNKSHVKDHCSQHNEKV